MTPFIAEQPLPLAAAENGAAGPAGAGGGTTQ
jgi:hypothetical protein